MLYLLPITVAGGAFLCGRVLLQERPPALVDRLAPTLHRSPQGSAVVESSRKTTDQHLILSVGLLGLTTVGGFGLPLLRLLAIPGLLYIDVHFVRRAYHRWQTTRRITLETNDAILATGLLVTGQPGATALFAAFYFTSRSLEERTATRIRAAQESPAEQIEERIVLPGDTVDVIWADEVIWQQQADRGALPLLLLTAVSAPFLGVSRALSVLLANFAYDYRVVAPITTLRALQSAAARGIHIRDGNVFEALQSIDIVAIDGEVALDFAASTVPHSTASEKALWVHTVNEDATTQIADWQAQGYRVAYVSSIAGDAPAFERADLTILVVQGAEPAARAERASDVLLSPHGSEQLHQLFDLADMQEARRRQGLAIALAPSVINLCGIFFLQFGPITALLVDYGGLGVGVLNAMRSPRAIGAKL